MLAVGLDGLLLESRDGGASFLASQRKDHATITALIDSQAQALLFSTHGPLQLELGFDTEAEVIKRANATVYGLAAGVVTENLSRAHLVIHQLEAGICWINTWGESPAEMPVGGYKQSGVGRENGITTLEHYTRLKSIQVELGGYSSVF